MALRIKVYVQVMSVWWVARMARYMYEIPAGLDQRLVPWPADWEASMQSRGDSFPTGDLHQEIYRIELVSGQTRSCVGMSRPYYRHIIPLEGATL